MHVQLRSRAPIRLRSFTGSSDSPSCAPRSMRSNPARSKRRLTCVSLMPRARAARGACARCRYASRAGRARISMDPGVPGAESADSMHAPIAHRSRPNGRDRVRIHTPGARSTRTRRYRPLPRRVRMKLSRRRSGPCDDRLLVRFDAPPLELGPNGMSLGRRCEP